MKGGGGGHKNFGGEGGSMYKGCAGWSGGILFQENLLPLTASEIISGAFYCVVLN